MSSNRIYVLTNTRKTSINIMFYTILKCILIINCTSNRRLISIKMIVAKIRIARETKILNKPFSSSKLFNICSSNTRSISCILHKCICCNYMIINLSFCNMHPTFFESKNNISTTNGNSIHCIIWLNHKFKCISKFGCTCSSGFKKNRFTKFMPISKSIIRKLLTRSRNKNGILTIIRPIRNSNKRNCKDCISTSITNSLKDLLIYNIVNIIVTTTFNNYSASSAINNNRISNVINNCVFNIIKHKLFSIYYFEMLLVVVK